MALNFKLIQRTAKTSTSDVMHSNGYANVENAHSFGASDNTTFSERQQIEQNRKMIRGYRNARVAQGVNRMPAARTYQQEQEMRSEMRKIDRQEFNSRQEMGGLRNFGANRAAQAERFSAPARPTPKTGGFGR